MATYILLITLAPEGRAKMLRDPDSLLQAENGTAIPGVQCLGLYGVLGDYDFVSILEAADNDAAAQFSLEFGVKAGAHIATLPAVPIGLFERRGGDDQGEETLGRTPPRERLTTIE